MLFYNLLHYYGIFFHCAFAPRSEAPMFDCVNMFVENALPQLRHSRVSVAASRVTRRPSDPLIRMRV